MGSRLSVAVIRVMLVMVLVSILAVGMAGRASAATIIYVRYHASGTHDGTSWASAYNTLQAALNHAVSGQQIWVAKGTYKPGVVRTATFTLKSGVAIYGGFAGTETLFSQRNWKTNVTILSGDIGTIGNASDNIYHVVTGGGADNTASLDGFTIRDGRADGANPNFGYNALNDGGGLYNVSSNPVLRNLIFTNNYAYDRGGGMFNYNSTSPLLLQNITFTGNQAGGVHNISGGGLYSDSSSPTLVNVTFQSNSGGGNGDGMATMTAGSPTLTRVTFINNGHSFMGGGMYNESTTPTLTNVVFRGNSANYGGGMENKFATATLTNVTFSGNTGSQGAGALYNVDGSDSVLTNVTFSGNSTTNSGSAGGAIYNWYSAPTFTNITVSGNSGQGSGDGMYNYHSNPLMYDSIFWGNGTQEIFDDTSSPTVADSIVQGGYSCGSCSNIINADPKLGLLQNNGGFTQTMALNTGSAALDRGNLATCATRDQRSVVRPQGFGCDLGAYEVRVMKFVSQAAYDGQVIESASGSNIGGIANSTNSTLFVGDTKDNRRLRGFLSFSTAPLPDAATIVMARLRAKQFAPPTGNPFGTEGKLVADLANPYFGSGPGLVNTDWQALATVSLAGTFGSIPVSGWCTAGLSGTARSKINKIGTTQFRLRFTVKDNNNQADYVIFNSGNDSTAADRPVLFVYYNP